MPLITKSSELHALLEEAKGAELLAFDTETTGFNSFRGDSCIGASFCFDGETGYYIQANLLPEFRKWVAGSHRGEDEGGRADCVD